MENGKDKFGSINNSSSGEEVTGIKRGAYMNYKLGSKWEGKKTGVTRIQVLEKDIGPSYSFAINCDLDCLADLGSEATKRKKISDKIR
jgi:hypothetical protein